MPALKLDDRTMAKLIRRINQIEKRLRASGTLKRQLGALLTAQTKRRIQSEKTTPRGRKWKPWSREYAATRGSGHSLLIDTGQLLDSIKSRVTKDGASITSDAENEYGQNYSAAVNKRRRFLGISTKNQKEIDVLLYDWMQRML